MTDAFKASDPPSVTVRFAGEISEPLIVVEGAVLSPDDAVRYAQEVFSAAARACAEARLDVAGTA